MKLRLAAGRILNVIKHVLIALFGFVYRSVALVRHFLHAPFRGKTRQRKYESPRTPRSEHLPSQANDSNSVLFAEELDGHTDLRCVVQSMRLPVRVGRHKHSLSVCAIQERLEVCEARPEQMNLKSVDVGLHGPTGGQFRGRVRGRRVAAVSCDLLNEKRREIDGLRAFAAGEQQCGEEGKLHKRRS
jgi:hypothetical protein